MNCSDEGCSTVVGDDSDGSNNDDDDGDNGDDSDEDANSKKHGSDDEI